MGDRRAAEAEMIVPSTLLTNEIAKWGNELPAEAEMIVPSTYRTHETAKWGTASHRNTLPSTLISNETPEMGEEDKPNRASDPAAEKRVVADSVHESRLPCGVSMKPAIALVALFICACGGAAEPHEHPQPTPTTAPHRRSRAANGESGPD